MFSSLGCYLLVLKWRGPHARWTTWTPLDELLPFQPSWVWVYLIPYLIGPVVVGLLRPATFRWFVSRGLVVVGMTLVLFILVPTQTAARPAAKLGDGFTAYLYQEMVAIDEPPANATPSLHVSLTFLLALALLVDFPRWWLPSVAGVMLVWLATLFTRQHHLLDVASGVFLTSLVVLSWPRRARTLS